MNPYVQYMYSYPHKTAYRPLDNVSLTAYIPLLAGRGHGLYFHIPFCQSKCGYCNLFSVAGQGEEEIERYLDAVERQGRQYKELLSGCGAEFSGLTVGGGTPLFLTAGQLERMFGISERYFRFCGERTIEVETAPNQTEKEKLRILKQAGVTRVSMGIQSFSDRELATLHRRHNAERAKEALHLIRDFGFPCVNIDFIYGIPGQTVESLLNSLKEALRFEPDEIFLYPLYVKHGARLEHEGMVLNPSAAYTQYQEAAGFLKGEGFCQDSMRRFTRRSRAREYSDCGFGTSLALGCGGRSYLGRLHFCSPYAITREKCLAGLGEYERTEDFSVIKHGILLSEEEVKRRYVIRHLLIYPGLGLRQYREAFGSCAMEDFPVLCDWTDKGYVRQGEYLSLTEEGLSLSDYLGPQLISPAIRRAMAEWEEHNGQAYGTLQGKPEKL